MKKMMILTGSTGGIGSKILDKVLSEEKDIRCCCLTRNLTSNADIHPEKSLKIEADFSALDKSYILSLEEWMKSNNDCCEVILVLAAALIEPIEAVGKLGAVLQENIFTNILSQVRLLDSIVKKADELNLAVRIIQFDSGAAYRPVCGWSLYCASKAYISMFLKTLYEEHEDYKVVLFDPGVVDTPMQKSIRNSTAEIFQERQIFIDFSQNGKLNDPETVAQYVVSRYILDWKAISINEKYKQ